MEDSEAWHAAVHGVTKSWTWLSNWTTTTSYLHTNSTGILLYAKASFLYSLLDNALQHTWLRDGTTILKIKYLSTSVYLPNTHLIDWLFSAAELFKVVVSNLCLQFFSSHFLSDHSKEMFVPNTSTKLLLSWYLLTSTYLNPKVSFQPWSKSTYWQHWNTQATTPFLKAIPLASRTQHPLVLSFYNIGPSFSVFHAGAPP